jgi:hypothetical protein
MIVTSAAVRDCRTIDQDGEVIRSAQAEQPFAHALGDDCLRIRFSRNVIQKQVDGGRISSLPPNREMQQAVIVLSGRFFHRWQSSSALNRRPPVHFLEAKKCSAPGEIKPSYRAALELLMQTRYERGFPTFCHTCQGDDNSSPSGRELPRFLDLQGKTRVEILSCGVGSRSLLLGLGRKGRRRIVR